MVRVGGNSLDCFYFLSEIGTKVISQERDGRKNIAGSKSDCGMNVNWVKTKLGIGARSGERLV